MWSSPAATSWAMRQTVSSGTAEKWWKSIGEGETNYEKHLCEALIAAKNEISEGR